MFLNFWFGLGAIIVAVFWPANASLVLWFDQEKLWGFLAPIYFFKATANCFFYDLGFLNGPSNSMPISND